MAEHIGVGDRSATPLTELAFAKVNLTLRIVGRRADGYHNLDSLVAFADLADRLSFVPGALLSVTVRGPTAAAVGPEADNLVRKAAEALAARVPSLTLGAFTLDKRLPVAAGLGGGSADAAAALRLLARANELALDDPRLLAAARATGADVPVCLDPRPRRMQGIGDVLSGPLPFPKLPAVVINPGVSVSTKQVFQSLRLDASATTCSVDALRKAPGDRNALIAALAPDRNDLEPAAIALAPMIGDALIALRDLPSCRLARMSGSGATCFALFDSDEAAKAAASLLHRDHAQWWIEPTAIGHP